MKQGEKLGHNKLQVQNNQIKGVQGLERCASQLQMLHLVMHIEQGAFVLVKVPGGSGSQLSALKVTYRGSRSGSVLCSRYDTKRRHVTKSCDPVTC